MINKHYPAHGELKKISTKFADKCMLLYRSPSYTKLKQMTFLFAD